MQGSAGSFIYPGPLGRGQIRVDPRLAIAACAVLLAAVAGFIILLRRPGAAPYSAMCRTPVSVIPTTWAPSGLRASLPVAPTRSSGKE